MGISAKKPQKYVIKKKSYYYAAIEIRIVDLWIEKQRSPTRPIDWLKIL